MFCSVKERRSRYQLISSCEREIEEGRFLSVYFGAAHRNNPQCWTYFKICGECFELLRILKIAHYLEIAAISTVMETIGDKHSASKISLNKLQKFELQKYPVAIFI